MSDTPRTDVAEHNMGSVVEPHYVVDADFSRDLERELAAAHEALSIANASADDQMFQKREAHAQRDKAIAFLHVYRNDTPLGNQPHMLAHEVDQFLKEGGK